MSRNRLFIEAKHAKTPECNFLKSLVNRYIPNKDFDFIFMDGYGNLFNEAIVNQMRSAIDEQENCLLFLDADTPKKTVALLQKRHGLRRI